MVVEGVKGRMKAVYKLDSFMDHAKQSQGGSFPDAEVEETKGLGRIIPVFIMLIFFWTVYTQVSVKRSEFNVQQLNSEFKVQQLKSEFKVKQLKSEFKVQQLKSEFKVKQLKSEFKVQQLLTSR